MPVRLTCQRDQLPLVDVTCPAGHSYPVYDGIPILLRGDVPETLWTISNSIKQAKGEAEFFKGDYLSNQLSGQPDSFMPLSMTASKSIQSLNCR